VGPQMRECYICGLSGSTNKVAGQDREAGLTVWVTQETVSGDEGSEP
jgi:hypothetical protein